MTWHYYALVATFAALAFGPAHEARAEDVQTFALAIKGNSFTPSEIHVPADKPFIIRLTNSNATPVELEAKDLKVEKVAAGNSEIVVRVKGMSAGKYLFVDEYQEDVAKGYVIAE